MGGCRSGVCWKALLATRATAFRSPAALQASSRWCAMISCGIAKPPRCFSRKARPRRRAKGSPTPTWRARCNRSRMRDGRAFTRGRWPPRWRRFSEENGGLFRLADFGRQKAIWGEPLVGRYRDVTVFNTPPPTQGFTVLEMLNLVEPHELHRKDFPRARPCPSPGAGQADRLPRPRSGAGRSRLCRCAGRAADIEAIRGRARPADRRKVGIEMGHGAVFRQSVRRYGLCRRRRS